MPAQRVSSPVDVHLPPFQTLLDTHARDVHHFLVATVGRVDADDCYQETWLAALRAYPKLRDASNLRSWIFTVAYRKAIDHTRARRRAAVPVGEVPEIPVETAPIERDDGLWGSVRGLPDKQRTALALRYLADAGYDEIAAVMQTSQDAARRNVHEALKRLRTEYQR
jgi:RNA polymerase sigma factor (sigma-70 family)